VLITVNSGFSIDPLNQSVYYSKNQSDVILIWIIPEGIHFTKLLLGPLLEHRTKAGVSPRSGN